ncbi:MAG: HAD-IIIA family hydrolase, partial [Candidatus Neomarinimicrobiota bacterium]
MKRYRLIIFDRDGTLNYEEQDYHRDLTALRPYPFTGKTLRALKTAGHLMALATNQSGISRGLWSRAEVDQLHGRFFAEWGLDLPVYMCPHMPDDGCTCR